MFYKTQRLIKKDRGSGKHPKAWEWSVLALGLPLNMLGAVIGIELFIRTGIVPNTSIIGALFAILISFIPFAPFRVFKDINRQNIIQTGISASTFSAANCMILAIGIPVLMGRYDLMMPMLIGSLIAIIIDGCFMYRCFDSDIFPAEAPWPPGIATAETIRTVAGKGNESFLMPVGIIFGIVGKLGNIPMDLLGVSWLGDYGAMAAMAAGSIVIGILKANAISFTVFNQNVELMTNVFGKGFHFEDHIAFAYSAHGVMIGAGLVSLIQCFVNLYRDKAPEADDLKESRTSSRLFKRSFVYTYLAYFVTAIVLAFITGLLGDMTGTKLLIWIAYAAFSAEASEIIVGLSAMHTGWFPGFATALIFLLIGMLMGFPAVSLGILAGFIISTGPCFSDMAYDLKCGYILRGSGSDPAFELEGRRQQLYAEIIGFIIAFLIVSVFASYYFKQGLFVAVSQTFATTIDAGANPEVARWLFIWAIPGALIQLAGRKHQSGILFATGLLVGNFLNGITILIGLLLRRIIVGKDKERQQMLNILVAGTLIGSTLCSFFTATLGLIHFHGNKN